MSRILNVLMFPALTVFESSHQRCRIKIVFLEISQNTRENTCARVSFFTFFGDVLKMFSGRNFAKWDCLQLKFQKNVHKNFQNTLYMSLRSETCWFSGTFRTMLTHFSPISHFYTPWKCQKTYGFLTFSRGIKMWHWTKVG